MASESALSTVDKLRESQVILASTSRLEIDLEEIRIIQSFPGNNLAGIKAEDMIEIKRAKEVSIDDVFNKLKV